MVIILCLYLVALWAVFSKFKLVRWGWLSGTISPIGGFSSSQYFSHLFTYRRVMMTCRVVWSQMISRASTV
jgi:hypothetical protein